MELSKSCCKGDMQQSAIPVLLSVWQERGLPEGFWRNDFTLFLT